MQHEAFLLYTNLRFSFLLEIVYILFFSEIEKEIRVCIKAQKLTGIVKLKKT